MQRSARMKKEIKMLTDSPPHGVSCWPKDDTMNVLEARKLGSRSARPTEIIGGEDTPYEGGIFKLEIQIPERYPFEPPKVKFLTPIYHPNIDTGGRICLDTLKMPPKGAWKPILNISTVLTSIQLLMSEPNPEDPLMTDISNEFRHNKPLYEVNAKAWTAKYAIQSIDVTSPFSENEAHTEQQENAAVGHNDCTNVQNSSADSRKRSLPMDNLTNKHVKTS